MQTSMASPTFRISDVEVARRARLPFIAAAMFGALGGLLGYGKSSSLLGAILAASATAGVIWFLKHREARAFLQWAPSHSLELGEAGLTVIDGATTSHLPYTGVKQIVVVGSAAKPRRVTMVRDNGSREILPAYGQMDRVIAELERRLGPGKVTYRRL